MDKIRSKSIEFLKFTEKYTRTDMVYLAKGGFWLGLGQIVSTGSAFIMSVAFANLISPDLYGVYKFVLSINSLLLITTLTGMDSAVTQSVSRGYEGTIDMGFKMKMKWGFIGTLISLAISTYYFINGNFLLSICFSIISLFIPFTESSDIYNSLLWGKKLFNVQAKYNAINLLITLAATTGALFVTQNLYIIIFVYLLTITVPNFFFLWLTKKNIQENTSVDIDASKYGKHLSAINALGLALAQLDKILLFHYVGAVDLAIYSLAVAPTDQVKGLLKNLNALAMPKLSEKNPEYIKKNLWHKVILLLTLTSLIVFVYILISPIFFHTFFPKYLSSIPYTQILAVSLIFAVTSAFLYTILESQKATKELYKYNVISNSISLITLFPLVYYFGIKGAVFSRLINRFIGLVLCYALVKKMS